MPLQIREQQNRGILAFFRRLFLQNLSIKLVSLAIALMLWLFVMLVEDVTRPVEVPLRFKIPQGMVLVSDVPKQARVFVSGPWATVKGFNAERLDETEVDLSDGELGTQTVYLEENLFRLPPGLRITKVAPASVSVTLAKRGKKDVPITARTQGTPADGFVVRATRTQPEKMGLIGSSSDLMFIDEIQTQPIDVSGKKESFTASVELVRPSKNLQLEKNAPVQVTVIIKKDVAETVLRNVIVEVRHSRYHAKVLPESIAVTVLGPRSALQELKENTIHAYLDATKEEGDIPGTTTVREVEFDPLPAPLKIKASSTTVKLQLSNEAAR